jgi:hypothetical protein
MKQYPCLRITFCFVVLASATGCGLAAGRAADAPLLPPTPKSITREHPGGDASDPERAALERLLAEPRGQRGDRFVTLKVSLFDPKNWQRVRLWAAPTRTAFQFGDERYAFDATWYAKAEGSSEPEACLSWFIKKAQPIADGYGVRVEETKTLHAHQDVRGERLPMLVKEMEGSVETMITSAEYVGAIAAYQSWPGTCLVRGFAVIATNHKDLALKVRERWVTESAPRLAWNPDVHEAPEPSSR